jgi:hypothetical protein
MTVPPQHVVLVRNECSPAAGDAKSTISYVLAWLVGEAKCWLLLTR